MSEESVRLLPCPLCGSAFKYGQEPHDNHPVAGMFYLFHDYGPLGSDARQCPLDIHRHFDTLEEAASKWNRRAISPAMGEETAVAAHVTETPEIEHAAGDVLSAAGWREKLDRILDEDAPNKWVWKTHASMDEWLRAEILPLLRTIRSIAKENSKAGAPSL